MAVVNGSSTDKHQLWFYGSSAPLGDGGRTDRRPFAFCKHGRLDFGCAAAKPPRVAGKISAARDDSLSERRSLFGSQAQARPYSFLRSDFVGLRDPLLRRLSQSRPVMGRRPAARDRLASTAARLRVAHPDPAQRCLDAETW